MPQVPPTGWTQDLCFQTCPRRGAVKLPVTALHLARSVSRRKRRCRRDRPTSVRAASASCACRRGRTLGSDTFTLHDVEQHAPARRRPGDAPAGRTSGEFLVLRTTASRASDDGWLAVRSTVPRRPTAEAMDGGARRDRTDDLMLAKHALSRLSYCPVQGNGFAPWGAAPVRAGRRWPRRSARRPTGGPGKTRTSDLTLIKRAL